MFGITKLNSASNLRRYKRLRSLKPKGISFLELYNKNVSRKF